MALSISGASFRAQRTSRALQLFTYPLIAAFLISLPIFAFADDNDGDDQACESGKPWHNTEDLLDVNCDQKSTIKDFNTLLSVYRKRIYTELLPPVSSSQTFLDVNDDGVFSGEDLETWMSLYTGEATQRLSIEYGTVIFENPLPHGSYTLLISQHKKYNSKYYDKDITEVTILITSEGQTNSLPAEPILELDQGYSWRVIDNDDASDSPEPITSGFFFHHGPVTCGQCNGIDVTICGTSSDEQILGYSSVDVIDGRGGDDHIEGGKGEDIICGGEGDDTIDGGKDDDTIYGEDGDDTLSGYSGNDLISGGSGNDTVSGEEGDDILYGDDGDDHLLGDGGDDSLYGGAGTDSLDGGDGINTLDHGEGEAISPLPVFTPTPTPTPTPVRLSPRWRFSRFSLFQRRLFGGVRTSTPVSTPTPTATPMPTPNTSRSRILFGRFNRTIQVAPTTTPTAEPAATSSPVRHGGFIARLLRWAWRR